MLHGSASGALELRATDGSVRVAGRFPYGRETELARGRSEVVAPDAFEWDEEALLLFQHDVGRPLASIRAGSLSLRSTPEALEVDAEIDSGTSWAADFLAAHRAKLITGLSPGFQVQPGGERVERRGDGILRTITSARLIEVSAVTRAAYPAAALAERSWQPGCVVTPRLHPSSRWRA
jgi:HK97 family phage prohead protease